MFWASLGYAACEFDCLPLSSQGFQNVVLPGNPLIVSVSLIEVLAVHSLRVYPAANVFEAKTGVSLGSGLEASLSRQSA